MKGNTMTISEFDALHHASDRGIWVALNPGESMQNLWESEELDCATRVWIATRPGVLTDKELRLFACFCARNVWDLLIDERSRVAVKVAELYAYGKATPEQLGCAGEHAWDACMESAPDAATVGARDAAYGTTIPNASEAALFAHGAGSRAAAWATPESADWDAAFAGQSEYLSTNTIPDFSGGEG